jgi:hypothetical protein
LAWIEGDELKAELRLESPVPTQPEEACGVPQTKWCVWHPGTQKFYGADRANWTYDLATAERMAVLFGGEVISMEELQKLTGKRV